MSEFAPISISLEDIYFQTPEDRKYWSETSKLAEQEGRIKAMAQQAVKLANDPEFQERIAVYRAFESRTELASSWAPLEGESRALIEQRDELLQWMRQFPGAAELSEATRYMAYVTVYSALARPSSV